MYELVKRPFQLRQEHRSLIEYYNELNFIFMELNYRRSNEMKCSIDPGNYRKHIAKDWIYMFLVGLDHNLDQINSHILATVPLSSLEEAYSMVRGAKTIDYEYCLSFRRIYLCCPNEPSMAGQLLYPSLYPF